MMDKTVRVIRPGEVVDDYSWALALTAQQRIDLATRLTQDLWRAAHGEEFPRMNRAIAKKVA